MRYFAQRLYRLLFSGLLLITVAVGCHATEPPQIVATNLTGMPVPDVVDQRIWAFMPEKTGVDTLFIVYDLASDAPDRDDDMRVLCYAAVTVGRKTANWYGSATRVAGEWFVTVPDTRRLDRSCADRDRV